jgi:hypothetical protein
MDANGVNFDAQRISHWRDDLLADGHSMARAAERNSKAD